MDARGRESMDSAMRKKRLKTGEADFPQMGRGRKLLAQGARDSVRVGSGVCARG